MKPLVLSIEDDVFFQKALELVLTKLGLELKMTDSVDEFMRLSRTLKPALFLVDLQLANADGLPLIHELRTHNKDTAILVLSGDSSPERVAQAIEFGANDFILKPIDRTLLASKLSQYLNTLPLMEHSAGVVRMDDKEIEVKLDFNLQIISLDEMGVNVQSPHLIPKKTAIRLKSDFFKTVSGQTDEVLVTVMSSYMDFDSGQYRLYAEFDESNSEFLELLRRWMMVNAKKMVSS